MSSVRAVYVPELDQVRVDLPSQGLSVLVLISPDQATRLAALIKTALVDRERRTQPRESSNVRITARGNAKRDS